MADGAHPQHVQIGLLERIVDHGQVVFEGLLSGGAEAHLYLLRLGGLRPLQEGRALVAETVADA